MVSSVFFHLQSGLRISWALVCVCVCVWGGVSLFSLTDLRSEEQPRPSRGLVRLERGLLGGDGEQVLL